MTPDVIVYGVIPGEDEVVFIPRPLADELAWLLEVVHRATTWGELRGALSAARFQECLDCGWDEEKGQPAADEPFSTDDLPALWSGDWPEHPAQHMLSWVPADVQRLGEVVTTLLNGEFLRFMEDDLDEIVEAMRAHRLLLERDDALVNAACNSFGE